MADNTKDFSRGDKKIVSLEEKILQRGLPVFCACPDCDIQSTFVPVVLSNKKGKFISALVCVGPQCMGEGIFIPVVNGYIQEPETWEEGDGPYYG
ncbi:MAG: hypothetical protein DI551_05230 [Micavibrio aeruginosavorus]|uniref:Uncharacterized protein n=1 Tax=Micavibrio aeruginosavorus TaxID=349221 RepID=A0A2W5N0Z9_9BACT|nr:MAG: hypothetical protein DI551_05230 [Micavibrio aeruginosavorus]